MYITHDGTRVTKVYSTTDPSLIKDQGTIQEVPKNAQVYKGAFLSHYDENWRRYTNQELYEKGLLEIPDGFIWDQELQEFRAGSPEELYKEGRLELSPYEKLDGNFIVDKTPSELFIDGLISSEDARELQAELTRGEAHRRIIEKWPEWAQLNAIRGAYGDDARSEMEAWVDAHRQSVEDLLSRADLVDIDVADDQWWPE